MQSRQILMITILLVRKLIILSWKEIKTFSVVLLNDSTGRGWQDGYKLAISAANRLIGEVVQSRRRPLLVLSHLRHYAKQALTPRSLNVK